MRSESEAGGAESSWSAWGDGRRCTKRWWHTQPELDDRAGKTVFEGGAEIIMIETEGITENVDAWRTDVPAKFIDGIGMEKLMFEVADPDVFAWYIKNYGAEVNLFVENSQIVQLECLRAGIWGTKSLWGRVVMYKE